MTGFSASRFGNSGGGSASFGSLTGDPTDNAALTAALDALLSLSGGQMSGPLSFSGTTHAGLTLNNLTTTQRNTIASPTAGMTMWNTTTARMNVHNGTGWTAGFVRLAGDTMTGALGVTLTGLGTTPTAGFTLANSTAATVGAPAQVSPSFILEGQGWKTDATAASQTVRFRQNVLPVQGTANPSGTFRLQSEINNSGTYTDRLTLDSAGTLTLGAFPASLVMGITTIFSATNGPRFQVSSADIFGLRGGVSLNIAQSRALGWSSSGSDSTEVPDLLLSRRAAASIQMGSDSATPVSQTLGVCAGVGTNIAGASFTIAAGRGTGTGAPGSVLFQTSTATGSGSTTQTLATRMTLNATDLVMASGIGLQLGNAAAAATPTPTHTLTVKDSTGTTYRIPCVI